MSKPYLYGWLIVALCFAGLSIAMSARSTLGLVMPVWEAEFGWSRSFISTGGTITLLVVAAVAPVAGNMLDHLGPRLLLTGGLVAVGVGLGLTSSITAPWHFIAAFSMIAALGFGTIANHIVSSIIALQFTEQRGLATGAATAGSTAGQLLVVPLLALLLSTAGRRFSFAALALAALVLAPVEDRRPARFQLQPA